MYRTEIEENWPKKSRDLLIALTRLESSAVDMYASTTMRINIQLNCQVKEKDTVGKITDQTTQLVSKELRPRKYVGITVGHQTLLLVNVFVVMTKKKIRCVDFSRSSG